MSDPILRLLVVDANKESITRIKHLLRESEMEVRVNAFTTLSAALKYLEEYEVDLVLLELELPDSTGIETFLKMYEFDVPIVAMTERDNESMGVTVLRHGAQDFLIKNGVLNCRGLKRAIIYSIERCAFVKNNTELLCNNAGLVCNSDVFSRARQVLQSSTKEIIEFGESYGAKKKNLQQHSTG